MVGALTSRCSSRATRRERGASARGRASWQRAVARTVEAKQANCERRVGAEDRQEERDGEDAGRGPRERVARLDDRRLRRLWSWLATTSKMRVHYELRLWSRRHVEIFRAVLSRSLPSLRLVFGFRFSLRGDDRGDPSPTAQ